MKNLIETMLASGAIICLMAISSMTSYAGEWKKDTDYEWLWWYQRDDGTYPYMCWQLIDGNYYYFDNMGYLETDTITPDGYTVDENGAWVENIPQMSEQEMEEYYTDILRWAFIEFYKGGVYTDKIEFEQEVRLFILDEKVAEELIYEIENNYTFVPWQPN